MTSRVLTPKIVKHMDNHNWISIEGNDFVAYSIRERHHLTAIKLWHTQINLRLRFHHWRLIGFKTGTMCTRIYTLEK